MFGLKTVSSRADLKGYLYDEFEKVQKLENQLKNERNKNTKLEQDLKESRASYVLIEQAQRRERDAVREKESAERLSESKQKEIDLMKQQIAEYKVHNNTLSNNLRTKSGDIERQIVEAVKEEQEKTRLAIEVQKQLNDELFVLRKSQEKTLDEAKNRAREEGAKNFKLDLEEKLVLAPASIGKKQVIQIIEAL